LNMKVAEEWRFLRFRAVKTWPRGGSRQIGSRRP